jgi:hypothetical protein
MIEQLTKEEAIEFHDSGKWKDMSFKQKASLQISQ